MFLGCDDDDDDDDEGGGKVDDEELNVLSEEKGRLYADSSRPPPHDPHDDFGAT